MFSVVWGQEIQTVQQQINQFAKQHHIVLTPQSVSTIYHYLTRTINEASAKTIITLYYNSQNSKTLPDYIQTHFQKIKIEIEKNFPLLSIFLNQKFNCIQHALINCLKRIHEDRKNLIDSHLISLKNDKIIINDISIGHGDPHDHHLGTMLLTVDNQKIVYKPRNSKIDELYQQLLAYLEISILSPKTILKEKYTWQSFIEYQHCENQAEIKEYYQQMGQLAALFYVLGSTDMHFENLIAWKKSPIFIDLETILHAPHAYGDWCHPYSILNIMLIPHTSFSSGIRKGIDLSAIGYEGNQYWPAEMEQGIDFHTSHPRYIKKFKKIKPSKNLPIKKINKKVINIAKNETVRGFSMIINKILNNKKSIIELIENKKDTEIRCLIRPTQTYHLLVTNSYHPALLSEENFRLQYLEQIKKSRYGKKLPDNIVEYEKKLMSEGEIPRFFTYINDKNLYSNNSIIYNDFFDQSPFDYTQKKIEQLGINEINLQKKIIQQSFDIMMIKREKK